MTTDSRHAFRSASSGFAQLVSRIPPEAWPRPALGVWDVRSLVGHAGRALTTIEDYLGRASSQPSLEGPVEYYLRALPDDADPEARTGRDAAIAERGREAGAALGAEPAATVAALADRIQALVARTPDDAPIGS
ncbi:MAG: maleylpyruvate isomerase N-terminal domain-containing protein, partial [Candidatus Dormibacteraeota bacterium]|nr:maleylpyruvate isomerase N-terminal domain-containing protein [Candidatus Dormibacteraeota bacterium]